MNPEISVITCHHRGNLIDGFLKSLMLQMGVNFEVIVVTSDREFADKRIKGVRILYNTGGPAEKRNLGAEFAKSSILAFFDDDTELSQDCLMTYVDFFKKHKTGFVFGKLWNGERRKRFDEAGGYLTSTGFIWSRAGQNDEDEGQFDTQEYILAGKSASCAIDVDSFWKAGCFDEDFWILGEETDLAWRCWLENIPVYWLPTATGYHYFNTSKKPANEYYTSERVQVFGCRNYITMLIKNLETRTLWRILPIHIALWCFAGLAMIGTLKIRQGLNIFRGLWQSMKRLPRTVEKRKRIQETRKVDDRTLWPHIFRRAPRGYYIQRITRYLNIGLHG